MIRFAFVLWMMILFAVAGCNKAETGSSSQAQVKAPATNQSGTVDQQPAAEYLSVAGSTIADSDGVEVVVVSVGEFDQNVTSMGGHIAIEGRVAEVYPDRGAFVLVDYDRMKDCSDGCCPQASVPVRLALDDFKGNLPEVETEVVIVGDLTLNETGGYELEIHEIRRGDDVLLSRTPATA